MQHRSVTIGGMWWRVRTTLTDRPGSLARIATACGEHDVNILSVQVFPELGHVVDELVIDAGEGWHAHELALLVTLAGGDEVAVSPCEEHDLSTAMVDEVVRWLRAAERVLTAPEERAAVVSGLAGLGASYAESARFDALLDLLAAGQAADQPSPDTVGIEHEVFADAVIARAADQVVGTASLDEEGQMTVVVSEEWQRLGIGRALFLTMAGVAAHRGDDEVVLLAPSGEDEQSATLAMLAAIGLRGLVRLRDGLLHVRVPLADVRPVDALGRVSPVGAATPAR